MRNSILLVLILLSPLLSSATPSLQGTYSCGRVALYIRHLSAYDYLIRTEPESERIEQPAYLSFSHLAEAPSFSGDVFSDRKEPIGKVVVSNEGRTLTFFYKDGEVQSCRWWSTTSGVWPISLGIDEIL